MPNEGPSKINTIPTGNRQSATTTTSNSSHGSNGSSSNWGSRCMSRAQVRFFFEFFYILLNKGPRRPTQVNDSRRRPLQAHDGQQVNDSSSRFVGGSRRDTSLAPGFLYILCTLTMFTRPYHYQTRPRRPMKAHEGPRKPTQQSSSRGGSRHVVSRAPGMSFLVLFKKFIDKIY